MTTALASRAIRKEITPRHLPGVEGAASVKTPGLKLIQMAITALVGHGGIVLVDGKVGTGKTHATECVLSGLDVYRFWVDMPDTPRGKEANARIFQAVSGRRAQPRMTEYALTEDVVDVMSGLQAVLVIDEAPNMTRSALRQVRFLHDRPNTCATFVLIGEGVFDAARQVPELDSRVSRRIRLQSLTSQELRRFLPEFHPLFANTGPDVLTQLGHAAKGNFRSWAHVVATALDIGVDPRTGIDAATAGHILRLMTGEARR